MRRSIFSRGQYFILTLVVLTALTWSLYQKYLDTSLTYSWQYDGIVTWFWHNMTWRHHYNYLRLLALAQSLCKIVFVHLYLLDRQNKFNMFQTCKNRVKLINCIQIFIKVPTPGSERFYPLKTAKIFQNTFLIIFFGKGWENCESFKFILYGLGVI